MGLKDRAAEWWYNFLYKLRGTKVPTLTIKKCKNGVVVLIKDHADFNEGQPENVVYTFGADNDDDETGKQGLVDLLYLVDNFCVPDEGRYSKERAEITLVHGDKYDCTDPKCPICHETEED